MKKKWKIILVIFLILIITSLSVVLILQYSNNKNKKKAKPTTVTTTKKEVEVKVVNVKSNSRPYAVMINNNTAVWGYQAGLNDAYLVYEIIVEGGITRLMAVFKDKETERIASVRSSRHYFLDYALENDAIYAHIGWSPQAESDIYSFGMDIINADNSAAFTWDNSLRNISSEHRAYTTIPKLKEVAESKGYRTTTDKGLLLKYKGEPIDLSSYEGAIQANKVTIPYSYYHTTSFVYDAENKVYKRFQNDSEHLDYVTGTQYEARNIITYKINNYTLNDGSGKGRQDITNIGNGEGYFISDGYAIEITWEKQDRSSKTIYKVKSTGEELVVNDGITYIEIQPDTMELTIE